MTRGPAATLPAVVVGIGNLVGLQTVRILSAEGVPVVGVADDPGQPLSSTRLCSRKIYADTGSDELVDALVDLSATLPSRPVLIPCDDRSVAVINRHRRRLGELYRFALPSGDMVDTLTDKSRFDAWARDQGLPVPRSVVLDAAGARAFAPDAVDPPLAFPCVVKPMTHRSTWFDHTSDKVIRVDDPADLRSTLDRAAGWTDKLIISEWVVGGVDELYSCNAYFDEDSTPLATFVARKIRQWPPEGGRSSLGEEVRNDRVLEVTLELFAAARFQGLAYLELKRDVRTGRHYIIEPNIGRPTGRSAIAEAGGVPILYTMYCDLAGLPLPAHREQRYRGVKWIYLRWDLQSAWVTWRRGELSAGDWWRSIRGRKAFAVWSWRDPWPFVKDLVVTAVQRVRGGRR